MSRAINTMISAIVVAEDTIAALTTAMNPNVARIRIMAISP